MRGRSEVNIHEGYASCKTIVCHSIVCGSHMKCARVRFFVVENLELLCVAESCNLGAIGEKEQEEYRTSLTRFCSVRVSLTALKFSK